MLEQDLLIRAIGDAGDHYRAIHYAHFVGESPCLRPCSFSRGVDTGFRALDVGYGVQG